LIEFAFGKAMEFRLDFYFRIFMDLVYYLVSFGFFQVLLLHSPTIGGWGRPEVMIFVGAFIVVDAVQMTLFSNNTWALPFLINKGDLDYYLVRPVSSFFMANYRDVAVNSFVKLLMEVGFVIYALVVYPKASGVLRITLFVGLFVSASFLFQLVRLIFVLPVFWTQSGRGLDSLYWSLEKFMERPHGVFRGFVRFFVTAILPFAVMTSLPTGVLFESDPWPSVWICLGVTILFYFVTTGLWRFALSNYSSASS